MSGHRPPVVPASAEPPDSAATERTALAWRRTALATLGVGLLLSRGVLGMSLTLSLVVVGAALVGAVALTALGELRSRQAHEAVTWARPLPDGLVLAVLPTLVVVLAGASLLLVALGTA